MPPTTGCWPCGARPRAWRGTAAAHRDQERAGAVRARQRHRARRPSAGGARHRQGPAARRSPRPRRRQLPLRGSRWPSPTSTATRSSSTGGHRRPSRSTGPCRTTPWASCAGATSVGATASSSGSTTRSSTSTPRARPGSTSSARARCLAALDAPRTGRMQDVVATIQAEQDVVIRRPRTRRDGRARARRVPARRPSRSTAPRTCCTPSGPHLAGAVLFVGPSTTFLRYVEDVVPSLGEDRVVLATPADLGPAVAVSKVDPPAAAAVKGDLRMVDVLARAVRGSRAGTAGGHRAVGGAVPSRRRPRRPRRHRDDGEATIDHAQRRPAARGAPASARAGEPRTGTASSATIGSAASVRKESATRRRSST